MREAVVLIHGAWMTGFEMLPLRRRLTAAGLQCFQFRYPSLMATPEANAVRLDRFIASVDADVVHLVAHSLGGLVVMHLFDENPLQRPGRVVMLGTPINGSRTAACFARSPLTRWLLGRSIRRGLLGGAPRWKGARELGMVAGHRGFGVGTLFCRSLEVPNDGTVALAETRAPEINAHLSVPYGHFALLWSQPVAKAVTAFLKTGDFAAS
ncbi:MAG: esterase/lipase family protein [Thioalkalivibrio sp.]